MIPYGWSTTARSVTSPLSTINIQVEDISEVFEMEMKESYSLLIPASHGEEAIVEAKTMFGALHGMEPLSLIVQRSSHSHTLLLLNAL